MNTVVTVVQTIAIFGVPALLMRLKETKLIKLIGTVGAAYLFGIITALIVFGINKLGANIVLNQDVGEIGSHAAIGIAIPLLLFNSNLKETKKLSKSVLISFGALTLSVLVVTVITFYAYGRSLENGGILSAMAVGLYTGGTPNLNSIGNIFGLDGTVIGIANLSDMLIGGVFYMFLLLAAKPLLKRFLKTPASEVYMKEASQIESYESLNLKNISDKKGLVRNLLIAFSMAAFGAAIGLVIWLLTGAKDGRMIDFLVPSLMITVTVLGIIASFNKKISSVKESSALGQYLILVFSFALAMSINLESLKDNFLSILLLYGIITVGSFIIHMIICKLARVDTDCAIVTLTAGIYGPAFIPAITRQLKNDSLTAPGLICGSLGYAVGTFLGLGIGLIFLL